MKARILTVAILLASVGGVTATQPSDTTTLPIIAELSEGSVTVVLPAALKARLAGTKAEQDDTETPAANTATNRNTSRVGFRVQIFDDNNVRTAKREAQTRKNQIESRFPE